MSSETKLPPTMCGAITLLQIPPDEPRGGEWTAHSSVGTYKSRKLYVTVVGEGLKLNVASIIILIKIIVYPSLLQNSRDRRADARVHESANMHVSTYTPASVMPRRCARPRWFRTRVLIKLISNCSAQNGIYVKQHQRFYSAVAVFTCVGVL